MADLSLSLLMLMLLGLVLFAQLSANMSRIQIKAEQAGGTLSLVWTFRLS